MYRNVQFPEYSIPCRCTVYNRKTEIIIYLRADVNFVFVDKQQKKNHARSRLLDAN